MRQFTEPTCKHLLRQPLVFGVPFPVLILLSILAIAIQVVARGDWKISTVGLALETLLYIALRIFSKFAKVGWDQSLLFLFERAFSRSKGSPGKLREEISE